MIALHLVFLAAGHPIITQVVEAEFGRGAVGDITIVHLTASLRIHTVLNTANRQAEHAEQVPHPLGVAACQIIIHCDQLAIAPRQSVQIERARRYQSLTFTRRHFRDMFFMDRDPADKLHIVMHHVPRQHVVTHVKLLPAHTARCVFHSRKCFRQQVIERLAILMALHKLSRLGAQLLLRKRLIFNFKRVDARNDWLTLLKIFLVVTSGKLFENG